MSADLKMLSIIGPAIAWCAAALYAADASPVSIIRAAENGCFFLSQGGFVPGSTYGEAFTRPASDVAPQDIRLPAAATPARPLRVLSWNLHHGVGEDGKLNLERIAAVIRNAKPDLVALQEMDNQCTRSGKIDQPAELAKLTGMTAIFGKAMDLQGGGYGQAIMSRYPITSSKVLQLPGKGEPRIAFEALISIDGAAMRFISVHLDLDAAQRLAQAETLIKLTATATSPVILCGDFNDTPGSPPLAAFARDWQAVAKKFPVLTCPAAVPTEEIDHFFVKGYSPTAALTVLPEAIASDHRPLLAELLRK